MHNACQGENLGLRNAAVRRLRKIQRVPTHFAGKVRKCNDFIMMSLEVHQIAMPLPGAAKVQHMPQNKRVSFTTSFSEPLSPHTPHRVPHFVPLMIDMLRYMLMSR